MRPFQPTSYDEVPYESRTVPDMHPDRLATMATLYGMRPAEVEHARVLELGCGNGANLLSVALTLPGASLLGLDASARQIEEGRRLAEALGLRKLELRAMSILEVEEDLGSFDYIFCHGVFSWVPRDVQEKILEICARQLAPNGVAYVSYNTYPGWHLKSIARDLMTYHANRFLDPQQRLEEGQAFLDLVVRFARDPDGDFRRILRAQAEELRSDPPFYVFHEHLDEHNNPCYFQQFVERAAAHGLQYLAPARFDTWEWNVPPELEERLEPLRLDRVRREQYLDFFTNCTFRRSLLCRGSVRLASGPFPEALDGLFASVLAHPVREKPEVASSQAEQFRSSHGDELTTTRPMVKALLVLLAEAHPAAIPCREIWPQVERRIRAAEDPCAGPEDLARVLLHSHVSNLVDLHVHPPRVLREPGTRPVASPLARFQALRDGRVTTLRHEVVEVGERERALLPALDGTRDRGELARYLSSSAGGTGGGPEPEGTAAQVEETLRRLAAQSLLLQ